METILIFMLVVSGVGLLMAIRLINELNDRLDAEIKHSITLEAVLTRKQEENEVLISEINDIYQHRNNLDEYFMEVK